MIGVLSQSQQYEYPDLTDSTKKLAEAELRLRLFLRKFRSLERVSIMSTRMNCRGR